MPLFHNGGAGGVVQYLIGFPVYAGGDAMRSFSQLGSLLCFVDGGGTGKRGAGPETRDRARFPFQLICSLPPSFADHNVINQDVFRRRGLKLDDLRYSTRVRKLPCTSERNIYRYTDHVHFGTA